MGSPSKSEIASMLFKAFLENEPIDQVASTHFKDLADAYDIADMLRETMIEGGEQPVGFKLGFTNLDRQQEMGLKDVIWGTLYKSRNYTFKQFDFKHFINPRIEPEIVFHVNRKIDSPLSHESVSQHVDKCAPGFEIVDSRYTNFRFNIIDIVADNAFAGGFVLGPWSPLPSNLGELKIQLDKNGSPVHSGIASTIMGDPLLSVCALSRLLHSRGQSIPEGSIVLAGGATPAEKIVKGMYFRAEFQKLGEVELEVRQ